MGASGLEATCLQSAGQRGGGIFSSTGDSLEVEAMESHQWLGTGQAGTALGPSSEKPGGGRHTAEWGLWPLGQT